MTSRRGSKERTSQRRWHNEVVNPTWGGRNAQNPHRVGEGKNVVAGHVEGEWR